MAGAQTDAVVVVDAFGAQWTFDVSGLDEPLAGHLLHLWDRPAADRPVAVSDLVLIAEDELGPHPDAERIVVETVRLMVEQQVLHVV